MIGRSYDATFLLLWPIDSKKIAGANEGSVNVYATPELRNAQNGELLPPVDVNYLKNLGAKLIAHSMKKVYDNQKEKDLKEKQYNSLGTTIDEETKITLQKEINQKKRDNESLVKIITDTDIKLKNKYYDGLLPIVTDLDLNLYIGDPAIWVEIKRLKNTYYFESLTPINLYKPNPILPDFQTGIYSDDGKNTLVVQVGGFQKINSRNIKLVLIAKEKEKDNAEAKRENTIKITNNREGQYVLYPRKVTANQDGGISIEFPSVQATNKNSDKLDYYLALAPAPDARLCDQLGNKGSLFDEEGQLKTGAGAKVYPLVRNLKASEKSEQPVIYTVKPIIDTVVSEGKTCKVRVNFERAKPPEGPATDNSKKAAGVIITTKQALIKAVYDKDGKSSADTTAKTDIAKNAAKLIKDGVFILEYDNIVGDRALNFVVQAVDGKDKPMEDPEQTFTVKVVEKDQAKTPK
jgi:hypothetical protein